MRVTGFGVQVSEFVFGIWVSGLWVLVFGVLGLVLEFSVVVSRFQFFSFKGLGVRTNPQKSCCKMAGRKTGPPAVTSWFLTIAAPSV